MSTFRRGGSEEIHLLAQGSDPSAVANSSIIYSKLVSGVAQLFARASGGVVTQVSPVPSAAKDYITCSMSTATYPTGQSFVVNTVIDFSIVDGSAGLNLVLGVAGTGQVSGLQAGSVYELTFGARMSTSGANSLCNYKLYDNTAATLIGAVNATCFSASNVYSNSGMTQISLIYKPSVLTAVSVRFVAGSDAGTTIAAIDSYFSVREI